MNLPLNKAFLCLNPTKRSITEAAVNCVVALKQFGIQPLFGERWRKVFQTPLFDDVPFLPQNEALRRCDFALIMGGDGTILRYSSMVAPSQKPVLGVNAGTVGFMTELETNELDYFSKLVVGDYSIDKRMMLDVTVLDREGEVIFSKVALNDAVVRCESLRVLDLNISVNKQRTIEFSGDGVVVATPTGSTAYSLSAGGPIVEPGNECISITPICAHALHIKAMVVSAQSEVRVQVSGDDESALLAIDGQTTIKLNAGDRVSIRKSHQYMSLIRLKDRGFYDIIRCKFL